MKRYAVIVVNSTLGDNYDSRRILYKPIIQWLSKNDYIINLDKSYVNYLKEREYVVFSDEIKEIGIAILKDCLDKHIRSVFRSKRQIDDMSLFDKAKKELDSSRSDC
jgi:hypothetical protein